MIIRTVEEIPEWSATERGSRSRLLTFQRDEAGQRSLLVFVHGLGSNAARSWGRIPHGFWREFSHADISFFEYPSGIERLWRWRAPTPRLLAEMLAQEIREAAHERMILFGHSMGGLLCKAAVGILIRENQQAALSKLRGLFLVATPQAGSKRVPQLIGPFTSDLRALRVHSKLQEEVEQVFRDHVDTSFPRVNQQKIPIPTFVVRAQRDRVVDRLSTDLGIPSVQIWTVAGGHGIAKSGDDAFPFMLRQAEQIFGSATGSISDIKPYLDKLSELTAEAPSFMESGAPDLESIDQRVSVVEPTDRVDLGSVEYSSMFFEDLHHFTEMASKKGVDWSALREKLRYCAILGDPGFGKSWLLRKEARRAIDHIGQGQANDQDVREFPIPFLVTVSDLAPRSSEESTDSWSRLIDRALLAVAAPEQSREGLARALLDQIRRGRPSLILLDALDESDFVSHSGHSEHWLQTDLRAFLSNPDSRVFITSRLLNYRSPRATSTPTEREVVLLPFTPRQLRGFVSSWFGGEDKEPVPDIITRFHASPELAALAQIPLMAAFICLTWSRDPENPPRSRGELLDRLIRSQLLRDGVEETRLGNTVRQLSALAWRLAIAPDGWRDRFLDVDLDEEIDPAVYGLLSREPQRGTYSFIHRTIHEYLCALHVAETGSVDELTAHLIRPEWTEVVALCGYTMRNPTPLLQALEEELPFLHLSTIFRGLLAAEGGRDSSSIDLERRIQLLIQSPSTTESLAAVRLLERLGTFAGQDRPETLDEVKSLAVQELMAEDPDYAHNHPDSDVRELAASLLVADLTEADAVRQYLSFPAQEVQEAAMSKLAGLSPDVDHLSEFLRGHTPTVQRVAADALSDLVENEEYLPELASTAEDAAAAVLLKHYIYRSSDTRVVMSYVGHEHQEVDEAARRTLHALAIHDADVRNRLLETEDELLQAVAVREAADAREFLPYLNRLGPSARRMAERSMSALSSEYLKELSLSFDHSFKEILDTRLAVENKDAHALRQLSRHENPDIAREALVALAETTGDWTGVVEQVMAAEVMAASDDDSARMFKIIVQNNPSNENLRTLTRHDDGAIRLLAATELMRRKRSLEPLTGTRDLNLTANLPSRLQASPWLIYSTMRHPSFGLAGQIWTEAFSSLIELIRIAPIQMSAIIESSWQSNTDTERVVQYEALWQGIGAARSNINQDQLSQLSDLLSLPTRWAWAYADERALWSERRKFE